MATHIFTAHVSERRTPVLLREGFAWGAFLFGPLWFFWNRLWLTGLLLGALGFALPTLAASVAPALSLPVGLLFQFVVALHARDLVRRSLARRGFVQAAVVAAPDVDAALLRLYASRPRLAPAGRPG